MNWLRVLQCVTRNAFEVTRDGRDLSFFICFEGIVFKKTGTDFMSRPDTMPPPNHRGSRELL